MNVSSSLQSSCMVAAILMGVVCSHGAAQLPGTVPIRAKGIGVDERLGAPVPIDQEFQDENGHPCRLSDVIDGKKPTLLTLNYSGCPGLCVAQLDGLVVGLNTMGDFNLGKDFNLISISIDPRETAEKALATKQRYTAGLEDRHEKKSWHFWTGTPTSIAKISEATGFRYTYDEKNDRYNHAAMAVAISPTGKITRYLYDVEFEPATMKLALLEASEGTIGSSLDSFLLWCMHYDENENRYSADAKKLLSLAAGVFVLIVVGAMAPFWLNRKSSNKSDPSACLASATNQKDTAIQANLSPNASTIELEELNNAEVSTLEEETTV